MFAYCAYYVLHYHFFGLHFHQSAYHRLRQLHVYVLVHQGGVGHQRGKHSLYVAHVLAGVGGYVVHHFVRYMQTVAVHLARQYVSAQCVVRTLYLHRQTPFEARQQPFLHIAQLQRRTVRGQYQLFARLVKVVEDMEEGVLCPLQAGEELYVVYYKDIHAHVEIKEGWYLVLLCRLLILQFEGKAPAGCSSSRPLRCLSRWRGASSRHRCPRI